MGSRRTITYNKTFVHVPYRKYSELFAFVTTFSSLRFVSERLAHSLKKYLVAFYFRVGLPP